MPTSVSNIVPTMLSVAAVEEQDRVDRADVAGFTQDDRTALVADGFHRKAASSCAWNSSRRHGLSADSGDRRSTDRRCHRAGGSRGNARLRRQLGRPRAAVGDALGSAVTHRSRHHRQQAWRQHEQGDETQKRTHWTLKDMDRSLLESCLFNMVLCAPKGYSLHRHAVRFMKKMAASAKVDL